MKTGDIVRVTDGSYALESNGRNIFGRASNFKGTSGNKLIAQGDFKVLKVRKNLPADTCRGMFKERNNTVIQAVKDPDCIVYIQSRFLVVQ